MKKDDITSTVLWLLAGVAVGVGVGMLIAPKSGDETREGLANRAGAKADGLAERGREIIERGKEVYERGRQIADEAADLFERSKRLVRG